MRLPDTCSPALDVTQLSGFMADGFVRIDQAFSRELAEQARDILWDDLAGCDRRNPATWTRPVIRLGMYSHEPFRRAANTPLLHRAFDQLVGVDRWQPCLAMGTFPVRFPSMEEPGDIGWHIDVGFDVHQPDFLDWRANVFSKGRALLMLFLFSDVGDDDAPTRLRAGSHRDIARQLSPAGEAGLTLRALATHQFVESIHRPEVLATGPAGTVYLCHPFIVHSAQAHRGARPRFMAQPPLLLRHDLSFRLDGGDLSPVEQAIRDGLAD